MHLDSHRHGVVWTSPHRPAHPQQAVFRVKDSKEERNHSTEAGGACALGEGDLELCESSVHHSTVSAQRRKAKRDCCLLESLDSYRYVSEYPSCVLVWKVDP